LSPATTQLWRTTTSTTPFDKMTMCGKSSMRVKQLCNYGVCISFHSLSGLSLPKVTITRDINRTYLCLPKPSSSEDARTINLANVNNSLRFPPTSTPSFSFCSPQTLTCTTLQSRMQILIHLRKIRRLSLQSKSSRDLSQETLSLQVLH